MIKTQRNKQTVIASVSVMLLLGLYYSWSVFANALVSNNHWSNADAMLPFTVCAFVYSLSCFLRVYCIKDLARGESSVYAAFP